MPTISSGISIALQAVLTHSQVLEITEHNIANASTRGYRRQSAILTTESPYSINGADHGLGAGQAGNGVTIDRIQRFNMAFLMDAIAQSLPKPKAGKHKAAFSHNWNRSWPKTPTMA